MIHRHQHLEALERLLRGNPVVALLGARQVGKTTLARQLARRRKGPAHVFDLESSADVARLADPLLALSPLKGFVVLDEVQRRPELFPTLRVLADRRPRPARFLVLGSASPSLLRQSSESLAGRIAYYELPGLSLAETGPKNIDLALSLRSGFPALQHVARQSCSVRSMDSTTSCATFSYAPSTQLGSPATAARAMPWNVSGRCRKYSLTPSPAYDAELASGVSTSSRHVFGDATSMSLEVRTLHGTGAPTAL